LGGALSKLSQVDFVEEVETNIVIFQLRPNEDIAGFMQLLQENKILISNMGQGKLRMVTHLDYTDAMHQQVMEVLGNI